MDVAQAAVGREEELVGRYVVEALAHSFGDVVGCLAVVGADVDDAGAQLAVRRAEEAVAQTRAGRARAAQLIAEARALRARDRSRASFTTARTTTVTALMRLPDPAAS